MKRALILAALLSSLQAHADPQVLRIAAIAPEGTAWARELRAFSREVETASKGELRLKVYLGGIAGDELTAVDRVRKRQLDGVAGAIFCQTLAPSLRGINVPGLFRSHEEALYVMGRMRSLIDEEIRKNGFADLGLGDFGFDIIFSKKPVRSLADLRRLKLWSWSLNPVWRSMLKSLGVAFVETDVDVASKAIDEQKLEGLIAFPVAALAYQWSTQMSYFVNAPTAFLPGCMVIANSTFDALPIEEQQILRTAAAKFFVRFNDVNRSTEDQLLGGLFEKQGLKRIEATPAFKAELAAATEKARAQLPEDLVSKDLLQKIAGWSKEFLADKRAAREMR